MSCIDENIFHMELVDVQSSFALKQHLQSEGAFGLTMFADISTPQ